MAYRIPRGTQDILPGESEKWQFIEQKIDDICSRFNYSEIRTPIFEQTELFARGVGDSTDIVQKEMYTFEDKGGRQLTLRPENTASIVRSYVENKMYGWAGQPVKLYYTGPMFRYERPQSGRMRQFVQFGVEAIGSADPAIDAEVIGLAMQFYEEMNLKGLKLVVNSLGDKESRIAHRAALVSHFEPRIGEFCSDCQERLHTNPLRILDCKKDKDHPLMADAPSILDHLNEESSSYFKQVKTMLDEMGISYEVDANLVRGLDYYTHTAFEIMIEGEGFGAITTLMGGGRYNGLIEDIGGPDTPGIGFALSIERLLMALNTQNVELPAEKDLDCYIVAMGKEAKKRSVSLVHELRRAGVKADKDYMDRKTKAQFKAADRTNSTFTVVIGDDELEAEAVNIKNMETGAQEEVPLSAFITTMQERTRRKAQ